MNASTTQVAIRRAEPGDLGRLANVLTDAFLIAPVGDWLIADVTERRKVYRRYFSIFLRHGLECGIVDVAVNLSGVAIWLPRDDDTPPIADYAAQLADACGAHTSRFQVLDDTFGQYHPRGRFHHHLLFLGVSPLSQGRGIGSALLEHHHQWLDREHIPAYLEASKTRNRDLYSRHDYQLRDGFWLPDNGPQLWPMWRDARPTTDT